MMMLGDSAMIVGRKYAGISRDAIHMKRAYHSGGWTALFEYCKQITGGQVI